MSGQRWHVIPRTRGMSALFLVIGLTFLATNGYRAWNEGLSVIQAVGLAAGLALVVSSIIGLVSQPSPEMEPVAGRRDSAG
jgi:hypothetical protein